MIYIMVKIVDDGDDHLSNIITLADGDICAVSHDVANMPEKHDVVKM